jgi:chloramphenicol O-acetyltransferase type A
MPAPSRYRVLTDYPRHPHLDFYRHHPNPFYGVSFELDATRLRARAKEVGGSTFAAFVWAYHRALQSIDAFRTRLIGDDVVLYDTLRIGTTVPAPRRTFTFATHEWQPDAVAFLAAAARAFAEAGTHVDLSAGAAPDFAYYTALPKVPFSSFTHVRLPDPRAGQAETAFGKFRDEGGRTMVPVGVLVNHLYVDGADLGELYEGTQASFDAAF